MGAPGWVAVGVSALTLVGLIVAGLTWLYRRVLKRLILLIEDWAGEEQRAGIKPRPGVMERLMTIEDRLAVVPALEARLTRVERRLSSIEAQMQASATQDRPRLEAGGVGQMERADADSGVRDAYGFIGKRSRQGDRS